MPPMTARIILLNGTSSVGKSTLVRELRPLLPDSFCYYASDQLADDGFRPVVPDARWQGRETFFNGFHRSIAAFASVGLDMLERFPIGWDHLIRQKALQLRVSSIVIAQVLA